MDQESELRNQESGIRVQITDRWIKDKGSRTGEQRSGIKDQGSGIRDQGSRAMEQGSWIRDQR